MFTWICPQCGREVLPSQSECPACAEKAQAAPQPVAPPPALPQQPQQQYAPPPVQYGPPPTKGMPSWLVTIFVAAGLLAVGAAAYHFLLSSSKSASSETEIPVTAKESSTPSTKAATGKVHSYAKHLEVAGVRLSEDTRQKLIVKMTVINHSAAEMAGLKLLVTLSTKGKVAQTLSEFPVTVSSLGPLESKDVTATVPTKLRAYELPDWQFLETSFQVTAP